MKRSTTLLFAAGAVLAACASPAPAPVVHLPDAPDAALGVKVEGLRLSAAGYMLDLRYRVLDVEKARPLFERGSRPILFEESTSAALGVPTTPKVGQLRTTGIRNVEANRSYSILFANPGRYASPGAKFTLMVGDARIDGLIVE